jgi:hypothetical protein
MLAASFVFIILMSIIIDIGAQINIGALWRPQKKELKYCQ